VSEETACTIVTEKGIEKMSCCCQWEVARNTSSEINLSVHQDGGLAIPEFRKYWSQRLASLEFVHHAITNKYPEAASVVQQVYTVLSGTENLAGCTQAKLTESSGWTCIVNCAGENTANFCKALDARAVLSVLCGMYVATLNELNTALNLSAQAGLSGAVNETSVESTAQDDDFHEVKRRKRHISNNTSETAKKSTKPDPTSTAVKLPPKAVLTRNFFAPFRTTDMDMETTEAKNTLPEQKAPENQVGRHQ
jgi:hypothetical protein